MPETKTIKNPSSLVLALLQLDSHFNDLNGLAERIDEIDLKSNFDFEHGEKLITRFAEAGQSISEDIVQFVKVLNETREQAELAAQKVAVKADLLKSRKENIQDNMGRFHSLSEKVTELNNSLVQFQRPDGQALLPAEIEKMKQHLTTVSDQLQPLISEAQELKTIGYNLKLKALEQNSESLRQSLIAVSHKISGILQTVH
jgi:hemerythrin superfamily protein